MAVGGDAPGLGADDGVDVGGDPLAVFELKEGGVFLAGGKQAAHGGLGEVEEGVAADAVGLEAGKGA